MKLIVLLFACSVMAMSSCKKEKENIDTRPQVRLSKIITKAQDRIRELSLLYNESGYITEINNRTKYFNSTIPEHLRKVVYTYDLSNLITQEQITDPATGSFTGFYEYNKKNQLEMVKYTLYGTPDSSYVQYVWGENNKMESFIVRGLAYASSTTILHDSKANVTEFREQSVVGERHDEYFNLRYDEHKNWVRTIKGLNNYTFFFGVTPQTLSSNNLVSYERNSNWAKNITGSYEYKLMYNIYGYVEREENMKTSEVREFYYEIVP